MPIFIRPQYHPILQRLSSSLSTIQIMMGPRQVGKSTLAHLIAKQFPRVHIASADDAVLSGSSTWIQQQWFTARSMTPKGETLLILDEVQKITDWASVVKKLWDEDTQKQTPIKVLLLGSSTLLLQKGLSDSLAGRFEVTHIPHWSYKECKQAFGMTCDEFIFFGGYPGATNIRHDLERWRNYIQSSLIETVLYKDIMMLAPIRNPSLLRRLFEMGCFYAGQILSYNKMVGQIQEKGNVSTLENYLKLLSAAGLISGIEKFCGEKVRQKASSPKLMPLNTGLIAACMNINFDEAKKDHANWGRFVEATVGAHMLNSQKETGVDVFYWREGHFEVDFILQKGTRIIAVEVKSSTLKGGLSGMDRFAQLYKPNNMMVVGAGGIPFEEFLSHPISHWFDL